jgi:hypothetical protein
MVNNKSLDELELITAVLCDVHTLHGTVFDRTALRCTTQVVRRRVVAEGIGFLTKTLPRLGKFLDKGLVEGYIDATDLSGTFPTLTGTRLPRFLGEFFQRIFSPSGAILVHPCTDSVRVIRDLSYLFYKYELPYTHEQEQEVTQKFERTERDLETSDRRLEEIASRLSSIVSCRRPQRREAGADPATTLREARILLSKLFASFDPFDIVPRHGPGAVATRQRLWDKFRWTNVSKAITDVYPLDAYFYASLGHVCDDYSAMSRIGDASLPARVILVPKDSRGPRLISAEPVDYQWIQQGLGRAIVSLVEHHPLTKWNVFYTDQSPNQRGALLGSSRLTWLTELGGKPSGSGTYSTLDLNEASDRVSLTLVRLLFPSQVYTCLEACRTSCTRLPDGRVIPLRKFAPMGSSLCFPILALTVWALLSAAAPDTDTRDGILVYGDDVIVPTAYAANAMNTLELFGLKVNRDKSCTSGFFRESCGMDAFQGVCVTPVRIRTVWSSRRHPGVYTSWIAYANSMWYRRYFNTYDYIVAHLHRVYGEIPDYSMPLGVPRLVEVSERWRPKTRRVNSNLQKLEYRVWDIRTPTIRRTMPGWSMLLRYFTEGAKATLACKRSDRKGINDYSLESPFSAGSYTSRDTSMLVKRWR